jgi:hypothetical protein
MYAIEFEYQRSFEGSAYTREVTSGSFNDDYNDDFDNE